ncbi:uncharacterized protein LOC128418372 isoform X1 [Podarcis raffonei]|uniref:uncharacterized protein LOC128418372 isoform X1 n=1 Tax=Podarcis raffonei TaxID=65483 RepID=UPI00232942E8|nr:uncharacterized protein LOC128418372 isoform X1 [Podarcis raffonei]
MPCMAVGAHFSLSTWGYWGAVLGSFIFCVPLPVCPALRCSQIHRLGTMGSCNAAANGSSVESNFKMGCATNCPSTNYTFSTLEDDLQNRIYCCQTLFCNERRIDWGGYGFNGLRCPFYDASDPENCPKLRNLRCRGDETRCFEFVLVHNDSSVPDKVYNGCATPTFCELARTSPYYDYLSGTITEARCGDTLPH